MTVTVVFDLDGTLVDTLDDIATGVNRALAEVVGTRIDRDRVRALVGSGVRNLMVQALPAAAAHRLDDALAAFLRHYDACKLDATRLYPGVAETLEELGGATMAVATNKPEGWARDLLDALGILGHFSVVVGGDTVKDPRSCCGDRSKAVRKPEAAYMRAVLERLGFDGGRGWMVGDSGVDITAGKNAGLGTIAVTYGFRDRDALAAFAPDHLVDRFEYIPGIVRGQR